MTFGEINGLLAIETNPSIVLASMRRMTHGRRFLVTEVVAASACAAALFVSGLIAPSAQAHGGGLDSKGCHTNRKTGDYHCHRSGSAPAPRVQTMRGNGGRNVYYANCSEARAAGAAPLRRGQPGYRPQMDRDGDGVACE